jgi:uncharacterized protein (TIGR04255 family)
MPEPLPEYDAPPVDEIVLGVSFPSLERWQAPYFGLYWTLIRNEYPNCETQQALPPVVNPSPFDLMDPNFVRCWFLDDSRNNLIQVQPNWFIRNWRKVRGDEVYPRYAKLRPSFEKEWERFITFLVQCEVKKPQAVYCECTYVNIIEPEDGWETLADLPQVTNLWPKRGNHTLLVKPNALSIVADFVNEDPQASLRILLNPAIRTRDNKNVIQLNLTVRGKPQSIETRDILAWMDAARDWVVRSFTEVTTPKMHKLWRRRI